MKSNPVPTEDSVLSIPESAWKLAEAACETLIVNKSPHKIVKDVLLAQAKNMKGLPFNGFSERHVVYVFLAKRYPALKVGHARSAFQRLELFQTGCPDRLEVVAEFLGGQPLEAAIHRWLSPEKIHGEWFNLTEQVASFVWWAVRNLELYKGGWSKGGIASRFWEKP